MKKYNYTKSDLSKKYELVQESAVLHLRKEMFREECWDHTAGRPIAECWNEDGSVKAECWSSGPGSTSTINTYSQPGGGDTMIGEEEHPTPSGHRELLIQHLTNAKECAGNWMAEGNLHEESHPKMEAVMEALHHIEELVKECMY